MIPDDVVRELQYIEIYAAKRMSNLRAGAYTSPLRGPGFDFDEHRLYLPGDDIRRIDWNATARMNTPYIRQTHAERELNVMIAVDVSRSMDFGTSRHSKREATTYVTASLLFSALSDQINAGFLAFGDRVLMYAPPRRNRARAWTLLEQLWALRSPAPRTLMRPALHHLMRNLKKMSVIFLISDFITEDDALVGPEIKMLTAKHDVIAVMLEDPAESTLPAGSGFVRLKDMESGAERAVGLGARTRGAYADFVGRRRRDLVSAFYSIPMDYVAIRSNENVVEPLLNMFATRTAR
ncbi:MAG: DUF58 domain-containing protein [Acidobacteria bacterium]|nr:DUF58 domain-containing protein [Acidobacteriota bacterium]